MARIICRVTDPDNRVVLGATVTATDASGEEHVLLYDRENEEYVIDDVASGDYTIEVTAYGFEDYTIEEPGVNVQRTVDAGLTPASIIGKVTNQNGEPVSGVCVSASGVTEDGNAASSVSDPTEDPGSYEIFSLPEGKYTVEVGTVENNVFTPDSQYIPAHNVVVSDGQTTTGIDFSLNIVQHFLGILDDARFSIETPISKDEANQAVSLFAVGNLMLAGLSQRVVGGAEKTDVLGVLSLYYGLQDKSLTGRVTFQNEQRLWDSIEEKLSYLASRLDSLQSDVAFLKEEIRRQFDMGTNTSVVGNVQFPVLFNRYVETGTNPLLSINISDAEDSPYFDKEKLEQVYDLLRDLKGVILQIVRSLSKYGTTATRRVNQDWAGFETRALEVLATASKEIVAADLDAKTTWALLAELTGNDRESHVAPHVALGRHGVKLLQYAMQIYGRVEEQGKIEDFDRDHLRLVFQNPDEEQFMTTLIRREAAFIRRYRLANWG